MHVNFRLLLFIAQAIYVSSQVYEIPIEKARYGLPFLYNAGWTLIN